MALGDAIGAALYGEPPKVPPNVLDRADRRELLEHLEAAEQLVTKLLASGGGEKDPELRRDAYAWLFKQASRAVDLAKGVR